MQNLPLNQNTESVATALPASQLPSFLPLAQARMHRKIRIVLPTTPRRQPCVAEPNQLAAARKAELAFWIASGGDFLFRAYYPAL